MNGPVRATFASWWKYPIGLAAVLAPLAFFWPPDVGAAGGEYEINVHFIAYNGEYFRQHRSFPEAIHTSDGIGAAAPMFYGYLLFKVAGLFSALTGPHLALRLVVFLSLLSVYASVRTTLRRLDATESLAALAACVVCWAIYPLTNLYNRGAFAEFIAGGLLTCSCCYWVQVFLLPRQGSGLRLALIAGLYLALTVGSHPITAMLSVPFLLLIYVLHWLLLPTERPGVLARHGVIALVGVLVLLPVAPWLYAYGALGEHLGIAKRFIPGLRYVDGDALSAAMIRLSPIPLDLPSVAPATPPRSVRNLDTQVNVAILLLTLLLAGKVFFQAATPRVRLLCSLAPFVALSIAAFILSVDREGFARGTGLRHPGFPNFLWKIQWSYRLIAVINLSMLLIVLVALACRLKADDRRQCGCVGLSRWLVGLLLVVSATGLIAKLHRGKESVARHHLPLHGADPDFEHWLLTQPVPVPRDYATPWDAPLLSDSDHSTVRRFPVGHGVTFGRPQPITLSLPRDGYVATQALLFQWSTFFVDGQAISKDRLRAWHDCRIGQPPSLATLRVAVPVSAGDHTIEYAVTPPAAWSWLNALAPWVVVAWSVLLLAAWSVEQVRRASNAAGLHGGLAPPVAVDVLVACPAA